DFGMNAVGADHDVAAMRLAIGETKPDAALVLVETDATGVEMEPARRAGIEGLAQHAVKIAPVHHPVGPAVERARGNAEVEQLPGPAGREQSDLLARGLGGDRLHVLFETERNQDAGAVGAELHAGAELAQLARLLEDLDLDAPLQQRQARDQP